MKLDRRPVRRTIRMCRSGGQGSPGWGFRRRLHPGLYSSRSFAAEVFAILTGANEMAAVRPGPGCGDCGSRAQRHCGRHQLGTH